ncbi:hypothetical protein ACFQ07_34020 [Actinomadura adrarensis]|uniref:site-specific DNA-methyltransferase (adenine-specific) n=1 Tax=Actinomadura adrarensis TaxID=1819600 RepID=A0ABW3CRT0_9ACTN
MSIPTADVLTEKQKVKAYIALHNAYGVDLNATGVELAEVSLWLNTMHPGMRAPWFGLHLRRGNSLIGARRAVYAGDDVTSPAKAWLKTKNPLPPTLLPFLTDGEPQPLPGDAVHQFLLPSPGWAAVTGSKEAKELDKEGVQQLAAWKRGILKSPKRNTKHLNKDGSPKIDGKTGRPKEEVSQFARLRKAALRAEFLWSTVVKRMELSEQAIARRIDLWEAKPSDPEYAFLQYPDEAERKEKVLDDLFNAADTPYWRLKNIMDAWCALWFWPSDQAGLLDGTSGDYTPRNDIRDPESLSELLGGVPLTGDQPPTEKLSDAAEPTESAVAPKANTGPRFVEVTPLFSVGPEQLLFDEHDPASDGAPPAEIKPIGTVKKTTSGPKATPGRKVIPLKELDDWLDFVEAMLGTGPVPENTLLDEINDLPRLKEFEASLPAVMGMSVSDPEERFPWFKTVRDIAKKQGFLHWELEFALVFARDGGFDLQVGNPPWVRPRWDEDAVLAEYEPWFMLTDKPPTAEKNRRRAAELAKPEVHGYVLAEQTTTAAVAEYLSAAPTYPLIAGGQPDLYRAFMCQTWDHMAPAGTVGMVHPNTHFNGDKEGRLREAAYRRLRIHGDFVNSGQRFFPRPVGDTSHFGVHIYGQPGEISFDHLSWLVSADALRHSAQHDGSGEVPGIRYRNGEFDERPHRTRVVRVDTRQLAVWQRLLEEADQPIEQARLLFPVSTAEASAIEALAVYPVRLGALSPRLARGYDESGAKKANLIDHNHPDPTTGLEYQPDSWRRVILKGTQLSVATPVFKRYDANSNDPFGADLVALPPDFVPDTAYVRVPGRIREYLREQDRWIDYWALARLRANGKAVARARRQVAQTNRIPEEQVAPDQVEALLEQRALRRYATFYRLAWRKMIAPNTERSLYAALIPPGPSHIDGIRSTSLPLDKDTCLIAGFFASLPLDYFLRITGRGDLHVGAAKVMPAGFPDHPLASALLLRTLRLNCLTIAYAALWAELYEPTWLEQEPWARDWPGLQPLNDVTPAWRPETPLRTERARRSALVEIDALVAVWLGMDADALIAAYRGRFPVLQKYEAVTWFDADGWKIAGNARTIGQRQTKESWKQFEPYRTAVETGRDPGAAPVPDGYRAPFYKADREVEMREAHAVFQKRLDDAIARGEWDPHRQEVVKP